MGIAAPRLTSTDFGLVEFAENVGRRALREIDSSSRSARGQFFTPSGVARLIASLSQPSSNVVRLLDAGAGVGMLTAAWIERICNADIRPEVISVTAFEIDRAFGAPLADVLAECGRMCESVGIHFAHTIHAEDFLETACGWFSEGLFSHEVPRFDTIVLNPPYKKIRTDSQERLWLRKAGIETSNLYAAFLSLAARALAESGEIIAITPRSFCNGPYFAPFRRDLLGRVSLTHLHVFESREAAFQEDAVLQENVIMRGVAGRTADNVVIEWSTAGDRDHVTSHSVPATEVVRPNDPDVFIRIPIDEWATTVAEIVNELDNTLESLDLSVSTGRVVDFRVKEHLQHDATENSVALIYPTHFSSGSIKWPRIGGKKANAIAFTDSTRPQLNPSGVYVLVKRFSAKEEPRRVVAAVVTPEDTPGDFIAFENHLNYFHRNGRSLPRLLAKGLAGYLNSTLVDTFFRQFNGHTQVNASDLRKLPYPSVEQFERIARRVEEGVTQEQLDFIVEEEILKVPTPAQGTNANASQLIAQAAEILEALGLPKAQYNERAALTLLALINLTPDKKWADATAPMCGVTPIMEFAAQHFGKSWKPNTRETVRRQTLHQFQDAGLVVANPDKPDRPVNSPAYCYQVPRHLLELLRLYGTPMWKEALSVYRAAAPALAEKYASERDMQRIPLSIGDGKTITLSPGGQNALIEKILKEFCPRFTPGAVPLYIGDADAKWGHFDEQAFSRLGIKLESHGKMPDVVVHYAEKNWLVLIEAVTSHGPVDPKRHGELKKLFADSKAPLVFVTTFLTRQAMARYVSEIAWETEVWAADAPSHLIHFNGERFLGPYEGTP